MKKLLSVIGLVLALSLVLIAGLEVNYRYFDLFGPKAKAETPLDACFGILKTGKPVIGVDAVTLKVKCAELGINLRHVRYYE